MYEQRCEVQNNYCIALRTDGALYRFIRSICLYYWMHRDPHPYVQEGCDYTAKCPEEDKKKIKNLENNYYEVEKN